MYFDCVIVAFLTLNCLSSWCYIKLCEILWYYHKWTESGISLSVFQIVQNYLFEQIFQHDAGEHEALLHFALYLHELFQERQVLKSNNEYMQW